MVDDARSHFQDVQVHRGVHPAQTVHGDALVDVVVAARGVLPPEAAGQHRRPQQFEEVGLAVRGHVLQCEKVAVRPAVDVFPVSPLPAQAEVALGLLRIDRARGVRRRHPLEPLQRETPRQQRPLAFFVEFGEVRVDHIVRAERVVSAGERAALDLLPPRIGPMRRSVEIPRKMRQERQRLPRQQGGVGVGEAEQVLAVEEHIAVGRHLAPAEALGQPDVFDRIVRPVIPPLREPVHGALRHFRQLRQVGERERAFRADHFVFRPSDRRESGDVDVEQARHVVKAEGIAADDEVLVGLAVGRPVFLEIFGEVQRVAAVARKIDP